MAPPATSQDTDPRLDRMLAEIEELPSIPETLLAIMRVIDDPSSGASDLAEVVRLDAPLAAKVLRLANSPFYGGRAEVADVVRCVAVLGYRTLRSVAISLTVATSLVSAVSRAGGRLDYRALWRHSVTVGAVAKRLATMGGDPEPEEVFSAGLLHDLGKFVLELHAPEAYDGVVHARRTSRRLLEDVEREAFGFDHAQVGAAFARSWRFPPLLLGCIAEHHRPPAAAVAGTREQRAVALVSLADHLANLHMPPGSDLGAAPRLRDAAGLFDAAGLDPADVEAARPDMTADVAEAVACLVLA